MKHKLLSLFLVAVVALFSLPVLAQDAEMPAILTLPDQIAEGRPVTITVSNMPASDQAEGRAAWEAQAARFTALYPNVTIEGLELQYDPASYVALAAANQLPTLFMTYFTEPSKFIPQGVVADIGQYIEAAGVADVFNPSALALASDSEGGIYGIPLNAYALGLAYNIPLLEAAGFSGAPTTWDELVSMATALNDSDNGVSGFAFINDGSGASGWQYTNIAYGFGTANDELIARNEDGSYSATYGSGDAVTAMEFVKALQWEHGVLPGSSLGWVQMTEALVADRVAMMVYAGDQFNFAFQNFPDADLSKYGYAPMPAGPEGSVSLIGGNLYMVAASADADQQEAATYFQLWRQFDPAEVAADLEANTSAIGQPVLPMYVGEYQEAWEAFRAPYNDLPVENYAAFNDAVEAGLVTLQPELNIAVQAYYSEIGIVVSEVLSNEGVDVAARMAESAETFESFVLADLAGQ